MVVKEVPHKGPSHHDNQGKYQKKQAGTAADSETSGVHGDKSEHPAIGKKHKTAKDDGRERFLFYEITHMEALPLFPPGRMTSSGSFFPFPAASAPSARRARKTKRGWAPR